MPFLLYSYLTAEIIGPFLAAFLIINLVLLFGQVVPLLDTILNMGINLADFLRMTSYLWPNLLVFSLPMAGMIGIILAFSRLAHDGEIMAMKAGGLGFRHFVVPVFLVGFVLSALSAYADITLSKQQVFSEGTGNFVLYVEHIDPNRNEWRGVFLSDLRDAAHPVIILAKQGRFSTDSDKLRILLQLENGSMHRYKGTTSQTIFFDRYQLSIPVKVPMVNPEKAGTTSEDALSFSQLLREAKKAGIHSEKGISLLIEFHSRLSGPVGCLLLCLLGLPLGLLAGPGKRAIGLPVGILFFLAYFILVSAGKAFSESNMLPVDVAMWMANAVYLGLVALLLYLARNEKLSLLSSWLEEASFRLRSALFKRKRNSEEVLP
ncbi:MAG: LptF/LptG family permease [Deltaproteobacteria bacterium]